MPLRGYTLRGFIFLRQIEYLLFKTVKPESNLFCNIWKFSTLKIMTFAEITLENKKTVLFCHFLAYNVVYIYEGNLPLLTKFALSDIIQTVLYELIQIEIQYIRDRIP